MYQRKDGSWCETVPRKGQTPKYFYGKTPSEVIKKIAAYREEDERGILFSEAAKAWLDDTEKKVRAATYYNYAAPYKRVLERFGDKRVLDITPAMIQRYIEEVASMGYARNRVAIYLGVISGAFRQAMLISENAVKYNPCDAVKIPSFSKNRTRELPPKWAIDLIKENVHEEFGLFPYLLIYTGLRKGEALALTDKDFSKDSISVTKAVKYISNRMEIGPPKSDAGIRDVVLLDPLKEVLPKWKGYLFSLDGGKSPLQPWQFIRLWNTYALKVGLAHEEEVVRTGKRNGKPRQYHAYRVVHDVCPHQLRHEFATICFDAGLDPMDTADMMGHASEEVTRQIYTHIKESRRKKTYSKLQEYVKNSY